MTQLRFGVFDHLDRVDVPLHDFYEQRLQIAKAYDDGGIYGYHVAEHHSTPLGMAPSPGVFFSAVAQRTQRLRFGPLVYLLPLYHPIRLAEEIAMLDQLSHGRYQVGVGRGISPIEATLYGGDPEENKAKFGEVLEILNRGFADGQINFDGEFFQFHNVPLEVRPKQQPHPPYWYGISSPESAPQCVARNFNGVTLSRPEAAAAICKQYLHEAHVAGRDDLFVGWGTFVVVGDTDEQAMAIASRAYPVWHKSFHYLYHAHGRSPVQGERPTTFEGMMAAGQAIAGSVETVTRMFHERHAQIGMNYVMAQLVFGDMTLAESLHSIGLFTERVMPALDVAAPTARA
jgi:alkanesulfonate monooxygenase SsuD/methylene tetrahydromethanopterin reductase-like flavin-dependent oxidoreductase (luciferase family)